MIASPMPAGTGMDGLAGTAVPSAVVLLALGCVLLLWGAEEFMEHIGAVARRVGLPVVAMGLLLAGAEPEEMVTALIAAGGGHPMLAATDAVGANVTMSTLGLGLAVLVAPVAVTGALRVYALCAAACGALAAWVLSDGLVTVPEAVVLVIVYVAVVAGVWRWQRTPPAFGELAEDDEDDDDDAEGGSPSGVPWWRNPWVAVLAGFAAMVLGGALAVDGAARLAAVSGLGERATGLTALAFATSAEVLALVASARRRGLTAVAVGGVLGSVIYNATLTLGGSALASAGVGAYSVPGLLAAAVLAAVLPLAVLVSWRGRSVRGVGAIMVLVYGAYLATVVTGRL